MSQYEGRQWMVDPECPWWAKLRRAESLMARPAVRVRRAVEAISGRSREDAVGRSQEAERDNDVGFVLNRLRNVYKHRRLPLLAATLAREGGR